jgi:hypothetical protein
MYLRRIAEKSPQQEFKENTTICAKPRSLRDFVRIKKKTKLGTDNMTTQHAKRSIPDRGHMIHGYLLKSKAKNAIKLSCHKDKPRLLGCLCKDLHT